jgi:AbrB family looped-hinge helix DNA binding protein
MPFATISDHGRITLPSAVRRSLGLKSGDIVEFTDLGEGRFSLSIAPVAGASLKGLIRRDQPAVTLDEMNIALTDTAQARHSRKRSR